jgi:Na+/melibiose symporter-like transporter
MLHSFAPVFLAAFRIRSFRFQWSADLLTSWAFEMETIVLGWYVLVQTGSVLWLTVFGSLQFLGTLAAPMYGVLGDRLGGRTMLCAMRAAYATLAAALAALALAGALTPAWVLVIAALAGLVRPNDLVMRNTLIGETIPAPHVMGALGLSRATGDSARVAGALTGAGLSTLLGIAVTYVAVTAVYAASLALTLGVARRPAVPDPGASRTATLPATSQWRELKDGLVHVWTTPALLAMMLLAFLVNLTAYPISNGLLPYAAKHVFRVDATVLAWLVASFSIGGLLASIVMAATGGSRRPERQTLVHCALWYVVLLAFGHLTSVGLALLTLAVAGFFQNVAMISMAATLLAASGPGLRGRVMGVRMLAVYGLPLGLLAAGVLIDRAGYAATLTAAAATGLLLTVAIGLRWRASMWRPAPAASLPHRA